MVLAYADNAGTDYAYSFRTYQTRNPRQRSGRSAGTTGTYGDAVTLPIWQVARATSAAPIYFPPIEIPRGDESGTVTFKDGGFGSNNPSERIYDDVIDKHGGKIQNMGPFISIGTGIPPIEMFPKKRARLGDPRNALTNFKAALKFPSRTTNVHQRMLQLSFNDNIEHFPYFRFDGGERLGEIPLDEWKGHRLTWLTGKEKTPGWTTLEKIYVATAAYLADPKVQRDLTECARILVRRRQLRMRNSSEWDRYASFSYYDCNVDGCDRPRSNKVHEFREHLRKFHPNTADHEIEQRVKECRRVYWKYRPNSPDPPLSTRTSILKQSINFSVDFSQKLSTLKIRDLRAAAFEALWDDLPRINLEGKVGNLEDPGDGLLYDEEKIQNASYILNALCWSWVSSGDRAASACPTTLPQMARICLILNGMRQPSLLYDFIDSNIVDADLPLSQSRLESIVRDSRIVYIQIFVTEQYRVVPRVWPEGSHVEIPEAEPLPLASDWYYAEESYGSVSRVRDLFSGKLYALKRQTMIQDHSLSSTARNHLHWEAMRLKSLSHKHIVQLEKSFQRGKMFGLLWTVAATNDLHGILDRFHRDDFDHPEGSTDGVWLRPVLLTSFGCLSVALGYMHKKCLSHKDINPANILYENASTRNEDARLILADFGRVYECSKTQESDTRNKHIYDRRYASPELLDDARGEEVDGYWQSSDVFSLGCIFLEMLAALVHTTLPLDMPESREYLDQGEVPYFCNYVSKLVSWTEISRDVGRLAPMFALAANMIQRNPQDRPTMDRVVDIISKAGSGYFCASCWSELSSNSKATSPTVTPLPTFITLKPLDMTPSTLEDIEKTVSQNCSTSGIRYNARFVLHLDLIRYVKEELSDSDFNSRSHSSLLSKSLAITGTAQAAYAATIDDYLKWKWPQNSDKTIQLLVDSMQTIEMGMYPLSFPIIRMQRWRNLPALVHRIFELTTVT